MFRIEPSEQDTKIKVARWTGNSWDSLERESRAEQARNRWRLKEEIGRGDGK